MMRKFAVFDIDGTYFRSHLYWEVVLAMAKAEKLHPEVNQMAIDLYSDWKRRKHATAFEDFDGQTVVKINQVLSEINPKNYDSIMVETLKPILDHIYMYPKKLKEQLQSEGYLILAISGSRKEEVDLFAKHHGFDDWVGQTWHRDRTGTKFTGEVTATYKDKHLLLEQLVKKHNLTYSGSYAIGDTAGDIGLLSIVETPIAFNPNHILLKTAREKGWKIVIERKSIAYILEPNASGVYELQ
jgi:HAD superfamily phosphoserine phosphatase-like hydrolase